jgi:hypothetical protein
MSNATSIVGTWSGFVAWGDSGPGVSNSSTLWTFKSDGSWSYEFGGGRWIQVEGLVTWNFTDNDEPAGLIYSANVTRNGIAGIMGYANAGSTPGTGSFYAVREAAAGAAGAAVAKGHDLTKRPHK